MLKLQFFPSNSKRKRAFCSVAITLPPFHARLPHWLNALYYEKSLKKLNLGWRNFSQKSSTVQFIPREREVKYEIVNSKCFFKPFSFNLKCFFKTVSFVSVDCQLSNNDDGCFSRSCDFTVASGDGSKQFSVSRCLTLKVTNKNFYLNIIRDRMFYISHNGLCCKKMTIN